MDVLGLQQWNKWPRSKTGDLTKDVEGIRQGSQEDRPAGN
jgi:hypothetical protein